MIPVRQMLVPPQKWHIKCPYNMIAETITVHNTYNDASANNEARYAVSNDKSVSYHYVVDDKEVIQIVDESRNAWAAGDGNGPGNRKSIHVEICYSLSGGVKYVAAEALAVKFIAQLLRERGWGIDKLRKHQDWNGKYCPHRILGEGRWEAFKQAVARELVSDTPYYVIVPNTAFWQARALVKRYEEKGFKCYGVAGKSYRQNEEPQENDPYQFYIETNLENAKWIRNELEAIGYDKAYGEVISK